MVNPSAINNITLSTFGGKFEKMKIIHSLFYFLIVAFCSFTQQEVTFRDKKTLQILGEKIGEMMTFDLVNPRKLKKTFTHLKFSISLKSSLIK